MTEVAQTNGGAATLSMDTVASLRSGLRGALLLPDVPDYDRARSIWNAMIDKRPALIVRATGAADVMRAVDFARQQGLVLSVRGGGHNIAGSAVCDGGVMIDLSPMKSVRIDPVRKTARVEPGVTLGEFDREAQAFGLATPLGINSTTGVGGLTLGGGFGWISRKHGLTIDNLLAVDIVTANGTLQHASADENPDLFWALRGGGGNFGIVTSFEFRLHPVGPEVMAGLVIHPLSNGRELLDGYLRVTAKAPEELTIWVVMRNAPPLPFLPEKLHGTGIMAFAACYAGDIAKGKHALAPLQALGKPHADTIAPMPFAAWQGAFDPLLAPGARNYWKSQNFATLGDQAIETILDHAGRLPSDDCEVFIGHLGGAVNQVATQATAYPHRDVDYIMNVHGRWADASQDTKCIAWSRKLFDDTTPFSTGGVYVNFMTEDETQRIAPGAYGPNYARLEKLKAKYDPKNLFRSNQNIRPAK